MYLILKPYKIATRNEKFFLNFPKFVRFLGNFLKNGHGRHETVATPIQNSFIFRETQWGSPPESFIQKYWPVSAIQRFEVENNFLRPFSLWNCAFLTIFDFKALYFWNQSIFLDETFRRASPLSFPENEAILDGHGNCSKTLLFQKMP